MRNVFKKIIILLLFAVLLASCAATATRLTQTIANSPIAATAAVGSLSLESVLLTSSGKSPDYTIQTTIPVLKSSHPYREAFNLRVSDLVQQETTAFKQNLDDWTPPPDMPESSMTLAYIDFSYNTRFASLQLIEDTYMAGAAHPSHRTISLVYDLETGKDVTLDQLFLPNANALQVIADYCKAELRKRDIGFDDQPGADPTPENYAVWNLSADGLVITFNEYQVAAYAAGPQTVIVPWDALEAVSDPQGPVGQTLP